MSRPPCFNCNAESCHDHHVVPRSLGGVATVPLCAPCHGLAHGHRGYRNTPELTKNALAKKKARGEAIGGTPYGYRRDGAFLVEDGAEQAVIQEILNLREQGLSLRAIAAMCAGKAYPTMHGAHWQAETVRKILNRKGRPLGKTSIYRILCQAEDR